MLIATVLMAFAISITITYYYFPRPPTYASPCDQQIGVAKISETKLSRLQFDAVTKFLLPEPARFPNAATVAPDGSVWFGEENVPGIGHLYSNGSYVEYAWPFNYAPSVTSIWGIVLWQGRVWGSDAQGAQLVGLNASNGDLVAVKLPNASAFPYTITVAPDGSLWFTELFGSKLGRLSTDCKLTEYPVPNTFGGFPTQIAFVNSTYAYYIDTGNATTGVGNVLAFNPSQFSPNNINDTGRLYAPTGIAIAPDGTIWVTQHGASSIAGRDPESQDWVLYPTSTVTYQYTTLPYFVATNGSLVWFNEHYANRIAKLDTGLGLLTEFSLSNPPASRIIGIDNALTFAVAKDKVWFTELTANNVGYVDASYQPNFTISPPNNPVIKMKPGENTNLTFTVQGESSQPLAIQFADTENYTAKPQKIIMTPNITEITSLNGQPELTVNVKTDETLTPGNYTLLITVTDGMISQSAYTHLQITTN